MGRSRWASLLGTGLCLVLVVACSSQASPPAPGALVLRLSDLPKATTLDSARSWTNAQAAARDGIGAGEYARHGRVTSREVHFIRRIMNGSEPTWLLHAENEVTEYRDAAGARWGYAKLVASMRQGFVWGATTLGTNSGQAQIRVPYRSLRVPRAGDADAGFTVDSGGDEVAWTTRVVVFRRNAYVVFLRVTGLVDEVAVSHVMALARKIDHRIVAAR